MSRALLGLSRIVCLGTLLVAPWLLSGRPPTVQLSLAVALAVAWTFWFLGRLIGRHNPSAGWSTETTLLVLVWCGGLSLAVAQLHLPLGGGLPADHAVAARVAPELFGERTTIAIGTQIPSLTRLQMARLLWPLMVLILGAELFAEPSFRRGLWLMMSLNGAALAIFGFIQRMTWNEQLYWMIPQPSPGQPFASFWNRNHAAGYLNLCLAAAVGLLAAGLRRFPDEWWPRRDIDGQPTARAALIQVLLIVIPLGVIASASRGGILSAAVACLALVVVSVATGLMPFARYFMASMVVAAVFAVSVGAWELAQSRFENFDYREALDDGRWRHWRDMLPAWNDVWHAGTGLGTYRYANRPYQNHALPTKYWNADNEYLELAIEGGLPAVALMVLAGIVLMAFVTRSCREEWLDDEDTADLGPTALFVVITQGLQAFTDYGISIPANALTFALVLGTLTGGWGRRLLTDTPQPRQLTWRWIPVLALTASAAMSLQRIAATTEITTYLQSLPELENPQSTDWTSLEADAALGRVERFLSQQPDDFQLHRALAQLHLLRYRQEVFAVMQNPQVVLRPLDPEVAWSRTHPSGWDVLSRKWVRENQLSALHAMQNEKVFRDHLPIAYAAFQRAQQSCPFDPQTDLQLALLAYPCGNGHADRARWLRNAIFAAPGEPKFLRQIALLTEPVLEDDLAAFCWRRAIALDPKYQDSIFQEAAERLAPGYVLEHVVEQNSASLLRFAEVINDPLVRTLTADRLQTLLTTGALPPSGESWMQLGRLEALQGHAKEASDHFGKAVRLEPLLWEYRLRYAEALASQGEFQMAEEQVRAGLRVAPEQPKLKALQQELMQRERKSQRL